jgi:predicted ATP-dependent endonuclease of OLD family
MDLIWVEIQGYKRFEEPAKMNLEGRLVALTGPNEAGKSSFLFAIRHLNTAEAFVNTGGVREFTRVYLFFLIRW